MVRLGWTWMAVAAAWVGGMPAWAQVAPVASYLAATTDDTVLRCAPGELMYVVARVPRGQILSVDGEGQGWARVAYPPGTFVYVPADSVQVEPGSGVAVITRPTRLKAANQSTGLRGSWKDVLDQPLGVGAKLTLVSTTPQDDGRGGLAYRAAPPDSARAYVAVHVLRRATPEEISAYQRSVGATSSGGAGAALGGGGPAAAGGSSPTGTPPPASSGPTVESKPVEIRPVEVRPSRYDRLQAAFEAVRAQSPHQAEYAELLAEFRKALAEIDPEDPQAPRLKRALQQRIEFLTLRADIQEQQRRLAEASAAISEDEKRLAERLAEVDRTRQYAIVGRLAASVIYDGQRLPLMYRIQAVGGPSPRTLAYVRPGPALNVESKLGQIVGVVGQATYDPALRLTVVTPVRIDTLEPARESPPPR